MADKHDPDDEIEMFDAVAHQAPKPGLRQEDFLMKYFARLRMLRGGIEKLSSVSKAHGQVDKPIRVKIAWRKARQQLVLIPAPATDLSAVRVSWSTKQQSASMRLRSAFLHYGIEMLKDSVWGLTASVEDLPIYGKCVAIDLKHVIHEVQEQKKESAKPKPSSKRGKSAKTDGPGTAAASSDAETPEET